MRGYLVLPAALLLLPAAALYLQAALGSPAEEAALAPNPGAAAPMGQAHRQDRAATEPVHPTHSQAPPSNSEPGGQAPHRIGPPDRQSTSPTQPGPGGTAGQTASAEPGGPWAKSAPLEAAVKEAMANFPGEYSVVVQEVETGHRWMYNPDRRYHPASTIKMPVALYALEQYRAGHIRWDDVIQYTPADYESPGGGAFETAPFGGWYTIENLVSRALRYSNNVAVNMLGRHFGWENIRAWTRSIGGELYRAEDGSPQITALSALSWWLHLERLSREDPQGAELLLEPLRNVTYTGRITAGLPEGVPHLHKFGSYDGHFHDSGIIYAEQPYVLIVLTYGARVDEADAAIARVSAAVYRVMSAKEA